MEIFAFQNLMQNDTESAKLLKGISYENMLLLLTHPVVLF